MSRAVKVVYPVKDGYRDSAAFTLDGRTGGSAIPVTGTARIEHGSKTVASWKLTDSDQKIVWKGRTGSKIVPGAYTFVASERGADGVSHSVRSAITVSAKKLVHHEKTVHESAEAVLKSDVAYGAKKGTCHEVGRDLDCVGTTGATSKHASLVASGWVKAPKAVRSSTKILAPTVRVTLMTDSRHGKAIWAATSGATKSATLRSGSHRDATLKVTAKAAMVKLQLRVGDHAKADVRSFTLAYHYVTLR